MKNNFLINSQLLFIFFLFSCGNPSVQNLSGSYISDSCDPISQAFGMYITEKVYISGSELELNTDSTFVYRTCGNIIKGNWKIRKDSLLLFVKSNRWRNDSLNKVGFSGNHPVLRKKDKPISFLIKRDGTLWGKFDGMNNEKKYTLVETLVKGSLEPR